MVDTEVYGCDARDDLWEKKARCSLAEMFEASLDKMSLSFNTSHEAWLRYSIAHGLYR